MIKVIDESSTRDSIELKFDSYKDMLDYINNKNNIQDWSINNPEIYLRIVDKSTLTTSISIGIDRFSVNNAKQLTITIGNNTNGPKFFNKYSEVINYINKYYELIMRDK